MFFFYVYLRDLSDYGTFNAVCANLHEPVPAQAERAHTVNRAFFLPQHTRTA